MIVVEGRSVVEWKLRRQMLAHFWMRLNSGSEILNSTLGGVALGGSNRALAGSRALKLPRDGPEGDHFLDGPPWHSSCMAPGQERKGRVIMLQRNLWWLEILDTHALTYAHNIFDRATPKQ